jgi:hypothetical protein
VEPVECINEAKSQKATKICALVTEQATQGVIIVAYITVVRRRNNFLKLLPLKTSMQIKWHLAWPCFPVLEVETSTT